MKYLFTSMGKIEIPLTDEQCDWFGNRMSESHTGRILVPTRLYDKFRKITRIDNLTNQQIKGFLIDTCY